MSEQTITDFLAARIAEDEAVALEISECESHDPVGQGFAGTIMQMVGEAAYGTISVDPARVLAECAAKRAILAEHADSGGSQGYVDNGYGWIDHACTTCGTSGEYGEPFPCATIKAIAAIYADHIEFQQDWAL